MEEKIEKLVAVVNEIIGKDEPTHEELDYDEDYIYFYDNLHNLKKALKNLGYLWFKNNNKKINLLLPPVNFKKRINFIKIDVERVL